MTDDTKDFPADVMAKIKHRGVFIEPQFQTAGKYLFICHTGISKFLPDLFETREQAIKAIDAKLDGVAPLPADVAGLT